MRENKPTGIRYYGGRKSDKLVRCYQKDELEVYRVELELHSKLLRQNFISTLDDFLHLPDVIVPKHLNFVELDWERLRRYLVSRFGVEGSRTFSRARERSASLHSLQRFLKKRGVVNFHRFLVPHPLNTDLARALKRWVGEFDNEKR